MDETQKACQVNAQFPLHTFQLESKRGGGHSRCRITSLEMLVKVSFLPPHSGSENISRKFKRASW